jgi:DNA-binding GntR family transcriptional regulator
MPIERLEARTMPDTVVEVLRRAIVDGTLPSGSQLREVSLAAELGISRAPLREAFRSLEIEGLVVKIPYRGAFVAGVDPRVADEIARLRLVLEPYAVKLGLGELRSDHHQNLADAVTRLRRTAASGDVGRSIDAHLAVHRVLYEASGNMKLIEIWKGWETNLRLFLALDHRAFGNLPKIVKNHVELLHTIETGDGPSIAREVRRHNRRLAGSDPHSVPTSSGSRRPHRPQRLPTRSPPST